MVEQFDAAVLSFFQSLHTPILSAVLKVITTLGEGGVIWIVLGLLLLLKKATRKTGITVLLALIFCLLTGNLFLKNVVARPRPCWRHPEVSLLIPVPWDFSFPSGHAMSSFAAAVAVWLSYRKAGAALLCFAAVMASTRLYFYVHYPTDILAGLLIGVLLAFAAQFCVDGWSRQRNKKRMDAM